MIGVEDAGVLALITSGASAAVSVLAVGVSAISRRGQARAIAWIDIAEENEVLLRATEAMIRKDPELEKDVTRTIIRRLHASIEKLIEIQHEITSRIGSKARD